jgi:hypothetical protein
MEVGNVDLKTVAREAAEGGHLDIIEELPGVPDARKIASRAIYRGYWEIALYSLNRSLIPPFTLDDIASWAARSGHIGIIAEFVDRGIDLDIVIGRAAGSGYREIVEAVLEYRPYSLERLNIAARKAAYGGYRSIVRLAIAKGANDFDSIAQLAAYGGYLEIVLEAIARGATALDEIARDAAYSGHWRLIEELIARGAKDLDSIAKVAASEGHREIVERLIARGAKDIDGIARRAALGGHLDLEAYLLNKGTSSSRL